MAASIIKVIIPLQISLIFRSSTRIKRGVDYSCKYKLNEKHYIGSVHLRVLTGLFYLNQVNFIIFRIYFWTKFILNFTKSFIFLLDFFL